MSQEPIEAAASPFKTPLSGVDFVVEWSAAARRRAEVKLPSLRQPQAPSFFFWHSPQV